MKSKKYTKLFEWQQRLKNEDLPCAKCGRTGYMSLDHIVPVSFFSMLGIQRETYDDEWNFQYLCRACNTLKGYRFDPSNPKSFENLKRYIALAEEFYGQKRS